MDIFKVLILLLSCMSLCYTQSDYTANLQSILSNAFEIYQITKLSEPFNLEYLGLRGGDVSSSYDIRAWDIEITGIPNLSFAEVNVTQNGPITIALQYDTQTVEILAKFNLTGLLNFLNVEGQGSFEVIPNLRHLTMYYRYMEVDDHIVLTDNSGYYSSYTTKSFQFDSANTDDASYLNTVATAVSERSLREMWQVYHNDEMHQFLNCVLQTMTITEIVMGNKLPLEAWSCAPFFTEPTIDPVSTTFYTNTEPPTEPESTETTFETVTTDQTMPPTTSDEMETTTDKVPNTTPFEPTDTEPAPNTTPSVTERTSAGTTQRPDPIDSVNCTGRPDTYFPHPFDCTKFIACRQEAAEIRNCPFPLLFDHILLLCLSPNVARCLGEEFSCVGKPDQYVPHPGDCSMYIRCLNEQARYLSCPSPLVFDAVQLICVSPQQVTCFNSVE